MIGYHIFGQLALIFRKIEGVVFTLWAYLNRIPAVLQFKAVNMGIAAQEAKIDRADRLAETAFKMALAAQERSEDTYSEAQERIESLRNELKA